MSLYSGLVSLVRQTSALAALNAAKAAYVADIDAQIAAATTAQANARTEVGNNAAEGAVYFVTVDGANHKVENVASTWTATNAE